VVGKCLSWPTDSILPALDIARALLLRPQVAAALGTRAMGAYSMAYAGGGGAKPEAIAAAQHQDVILKMIMSARADQGSTPPAPVVFMAQRAICNGFMHAEMKPLLQLHLNTAAMVFKDLDKTHKQVQVAYASLVNNYAVLFKGQPVPESAWSAILASSVALFKTFNEQSDVQAMYRLCAGVGTFVDGNVTRIQAATALKVPGLAREQVLESDAVKGGVGTMGDPKTQRCCYALLETLSVAQYLQPGLKVADNDAEFEKIVKYAGGKAVIVDFAASWCGPCKVIGPIFDQLAEETPQAVFVKVDVDQCRSTATKFKVEAMPTFKLLHMGREMASIQGANEAGLKELVAKVVAASGGGGGAGGTRAGVDAGDVDQ
jgi:thioredoxin